MNVSVTITAVGNFAIVNGEERANSDETSKI